MAYIVPADISQLALAGCHAPELETLARLKKDLSADYTVFHGVHWTREYQGNTVFGELDFVVVNRSGEVLLIEQKNGRLEETERGLEKRYDDRGRVIAEQIRRALEKVREKFKWQQGAGLNLDYLFYCPDYQVRNVNAAGIDASRIVDAGSADRLPEVIDQLLSPGQGEDETWCETVEGFFRQSFDLVPDIHAYARAGEKTFARLSGGLAEVLSHLEMEPLRLRVRGAVIPAAFPK